MDPAATVTLNLFSLVDLLGAVVTGPVLIVFIVRYLWVTRQPTDLLFACVMFVVFLWCSLVFMVDNVVPASVRADSVPGAAATTVLLIRLQFAAGALLMAATSHFALRYTQSNILPGWQVAWLYLLSCGLLRVIWTDHFIRELPEPLGLHASWRLAVPWQPTPGPLGHVYIVMWLGAMSFVQYLLWRRPATDLTSSSGAARSNTVRAGLSVVGISGLVGITEALIGYAGISIGTLTVWVGMIVVAFGLAREWKMSKRERKHVKQRFESYVDPALVQYVIAHPEQTHFDGEVRELTVAFTDLESYTPLTERLRERAVPLLNEYLSAMTPLIREHNGYRSKFLGDGIMFFYGAPEWNCDHAIQAVSTVLKMQETMIELNERLVARGLPALSMRIGVNSGDMVVGDAGSDEASDYTVLGDAVNLGARLETANKYTGTRVLVSEGTVKLLPSDLFLLRPIGKLQVVGLSRAVMTYEPLAYANHATDAQRRTVKLTRQMVEAFQSGDFRACLTAVTHLEETVGSSKLGLLYRGLCELYLREPPTSPFAGEIVLTDK